MPKPGIRELYQVHAYIQSDAPDDLPAPSFDNPSPARADQTPGSIVPTIIIPQDDKAGVKQALTKLYLASKCCFCLAVSTYITTHVHNQKEDEVSRAVRRQRLQDGADATTAILLTESPPNPRTVEASIDAKIRKEHASTKRSIQSSNDRNTKRMRELEASQKKENNEISKLKAKLDRLMQEKGAKSSGGPPTGAQTKKSTEHPTTRPTQRTSSSRPQGARPPHRQNTSGRGRGGGRDQGRERRPEPNYYGPPPHRPNHNPTPTPKETPVIQEFSGGRSSWTPQTTQEAAKTATMPLPNDGWGRSDTPLPNDGWGRSDRYSPATPVGDSSVAKTSLVQKNSHNSVKRNLGVRFSD